MGTAHQATARGGLALGGTARFQVVKNLAMTPEADAFLADLSEKTGLSEGQVIRLALTLFKIAVEAKQQGKHVGIAESSDVFEIELDGF